MPAPLYGGRPVHDAGTISVAANSRTVTGVATAWVTPNGDQAFVGVGDVLMVPGQPVGVVESVASPTSLTLVSPWTGPAQTNVAYKIVILSDPSGAAARLARQVIERFADVEAGLGNRLRFDANQGLTPAQQAQGRANLALGDLATNTLANLDARFLWLGGGTLSGKLNMQNQPLCWATRAPGGAFETYAADLHYGWLGTAGVNIGGFYGGATLPGGGAALHVPSAGKYIAILRAYGTAAGSSRRLALTVNGFDATFVTLGPTTGDQSIAGVGILTLAANDYLGFRPRFAPFPAFAAYEHTDLLLYMLG